MDTEKVEKEEIIDTESSEKIEPDVILDDDSKGEEPNLETDDELTDTDTDIDDDDDDDDDVVSIIGEAPEPEENKKPAAEWVRDVRKENREVKRKNKELAKKINDLERGNSPEIKPIGPKPTLDSLDYDAEKFEKNLSSWYERKHKQDSDDKISKSKQDDLQKDWDIKLEGYNTLKKKLRVPDYDVAEDIVHDHLSVTQQGMIVQGADNPALVVYALGKNPKKVKEISSITDPIKFAFAVSKLETNLKVTKRKAKTKPEERVNGTGKLSGTINNTLEKLREDAAKTGDFTKVIRYNKQKSSG